MRQRTIGNGEGATLLGYPSYGVPAALGSRGSGRARSKHERLCRVLIFGSSWRKRGGKLSELGMRS